MSFAKILGRILCYGIGTASYSNKIIENINQNPSKLFNEENKQNLGISIGAAAFGTNIAVHDAYSGLKSLFFPISNSFIDNSWDFNKNYLELRKDVNDFGTKALTDQEIMTIKNLNINDSKSLEELSENQKRIIFNEVRKEGINISNYCYKFTKFSPNLLPSSTYQNILFERFPKKLKNECVRIINHISNVETSILNNGYYKDHPILLRHLSKQKKGILVRVVGGNHRLQAVRNLIGARKLRKSFKIPCLIIIPIN